MWLKLGVSSEKIQFGTIEKGDKKIKPKFKNTCAMLHYLNLTTFVIFMKI